MSGFCTGSLTYSDKYGEVACDSYGIPYWKSSVSSFTSKYGGRVVPLRFIKPYMPKTYTLKNCDFKVGPDTMSNEMHCEEAAKLRLCATLIWSMEQKTDKAKVVFNKWYQEEANGKVDEENFKWVYGNIVKICSEDEYTYDCKPANHCAATIDGVKYTNGGNNLGSAKLGELVNCKSYSGVTAFVDHRLPTTIHICPVLFLKQVPELNHNVGWRSRLGIIFHEFSHFKYTMSNKDNTYKSEKILAPERVAHSAEDKLMDDNAKTFDNFVEHLYQTTGVMTWADIAKLSGKTYSNTGNQAKLDAKCQGSQYKFNKGGQSVNAADTLVIFLLVIILLFRF